MRALLKQVDLIVREIRALIRSSSRALAANSVAPEG